MFKALSDIGYERIEFAGYTQHANAEGGPNLETIAGATAAAHGGWTTTG